jgi:hypothetical protein
MALIDTERDDRAMLEAEDEAIRQAARAANDPQPVDGGTVQAPPGTPLANLIGLLRDGDSTQVHGEATG